MRFPRQPTLCPHCPYCWLAVVPVLFVLLISNLNFLPLLLICLLTTGLENKLYSLQQMFSKITIKNNVDTMSSGCIPTSLSSRMKMLFLISLLSESPPNLWTRGGKGQTNACPRMQSGPLLYCSSQICLFQVISSGIFQENEIPLSGLPQATACPDFLIVAPFPNNQVIPPTTSPVKYAFLMSYNSSSPHCLVHHSVISLLPAVWLNPYSLTSTTRTGQSLKGRMSDREGKEQYAFDRDVTVCSVATLLSDAAAACQCLAQAAISAQLKLPIF